ncbi:uncharacterized protein LOC114330279 [Diabrotica virgifera virgifera]|uniref:Uncharacterized protein LOC114330279 n=1 Tax=Diabrotica virgifera virgifera TaxID=50390 RepID=A0A6P7FHP1_DIAVI|nr:uncharacterized protein LOC114330279 [Diabrotica virgifera virgifera]
MNHEEESILNDNQLQYLIKKYVKELHEKKNKGFDENTEESSIDVKINNFSIRPKENKIVREQFYLTINYQIDAKEHEANFFVKIISKLNSLMYQIAEETSTFEKEKFFYDLYVPYLKEEGFDCNYTCKSYFCESDVVVLEDLGISGYKIFEKEPCFDLDHCRACLKTIARFHGDCILFELNKSKDLDWEYKLIEAFPEIFQDSVVIDLNRLIIKHCQNLVRGLKKLTSFIPENKISEKEFKGAFDKALSKLPSELNANLKNYRNVLSHNCLWPNKFLFKYDEDDNIISCKIVDFQTIGLQPPVYDVLIFLYINTRKSFRDEYLQDLLGYYYKCFSDYIKKGGYTASEIISEEEFYETYKKLRFLCKLHAMMDRSCMLIPDVIYSKYLKNDEDFTYFFFEGRPDSMVKIFQGNSYYREILTEDLIEMRSIIFDDER